jgi:hypothetical protein
VIRALNPLVLVVLLLQAFIDLDVAVNLPGWRLDAPVADLIGALLLGAVWILPRRDRPSPPAVAGAVAFVAVALASTALREVVLPGHGRLESLHWLVRKPVFMYLAYATALPWALWAVGQERVRTWLLAALAVTAAISVTTSLLRVAGGQALWWTTIEGLTPNHKTLAVWMAPFVPWLWTCRRPGVLGVLGLCAVAMALATSKTAWLTAIVGLAWVVHWRGRPLVARWHVTAAALVGAVALAVASPWLTGSITMEDAARSRRSLDLRAFTMWRESPILGQGPGTSTAWEMTEYPHYRINGVEAHGVAQKLAAEEGLLGLLAWGGFTVLLARAMRRAWDGDTRGEGWAWLGVVVSLHVNLLASTEAFSMTHWIPLGMAWAALRGGAPPRGPPCAS